MTCYIALLPARRYLSKSDFVEFARLAEVLTFRYSTVVGLGTNELERKYRDAAQILIASKGAHLAEARRILIDAMPDSHTFRSSFERMRMGTQYLLRYTLRKLEEHEAPSVEKSIKTSGLVHIEHVMPQTLSAEWKDALGADGVERHSEYLNKYGNLTLFYSGLNIPASNKAFHDKKAYYEQSQVELTRRLTTYSTWGIDQIDERQEELAELADLVWSIPETVREEGEPPTPQARDTFRESLGELWPWVEPFGGETTPDELSKIIERLPAHLSTEDHADSAALLGGRVLSLLEDWEQLDGNARWVLTAAARYFLEPDDAIPDRSRSGLKDDELVVRAAAQAIGRAN
jgi:hypothetical protein